MDSMDDRRDEALRYVESHHVMTLATHGPEGPWAAAVFYVNRQFNLTFLSSATSRHGGDLAIAGRAAAAIHEDYDGWSQIKGIQLEGQVHKLTGKLRIEAIARYARKFPVVQPDNAPALIKAALRKVSWYELVPDRCYLVDNSLGFGHRDEIELPSTQPPSP